MADPAAMDALDTAAKGGVGMLLGMGLLRLAERLVEKWRPASRGGLDRRVERLEERFEERVEKALGNHAGKIESLQVAQARTEMVLEMKTGVRIASVTIPEADNAD